MNGIANLHYPVFRNKTELLRTAWWGPEARESVWGAAHEEPSPFTSMFVSRSWSKRLF